MTIHFYEIGTLWQTLLLVLSQLAVITLAGGCILVFRHRYCVLRKLGMGAALLLNATLYVLMQLDSGITEAGQTLPLNTPYAVLLPVICLSLGYAVWAILLETKNRKTINHTSIKEAFDNLPTGVCFFNEAGLPVLCNRAMHKFSFAVCGKDVQFISELRDCLSEDFVPLEGTVKNGKHFTLTDGSVKSLEERSFTHKSGAVYTQYIALDVTELQKNRAALQTETIHLRKVQAELARLSANMVAITREEEILNTKMRLHDEMGRCLVEAGKYLRPDSDGSIPDRVALSWQRAVSTLKYNNDTADEDMLLQIRQTCQAIRLDFHQTGKLPKEERTAYLLTCAVRECVTNAVRYAEANRLYADFTETDATATVSVTNDGTAPNGEITEGGGLSTLRRRVERAGGVMTIQSQPTFRLTVTVPKRKETGL